MTTTSFLINKKDLFNTTFETVELGELNEGEALLEIEKYAFTTNNVTYAVFGERLNYWQFFPANGDFGILPAWGYAKVVASKSAGVPVGERVYGFVPTSRYLKVQVGRVNPFGFVDASAHRVDLPSIYNYYNRLNNDASYRAATEDYIPIFRPLFATSFLCYYFLKDQQFYGGENIFLTSASAKTALALAYMLKRNQQNDGRKIIGLTSSRNIEFVKGTGFYDEVWDYNHYAEHLPSTASMLIDFTGNMELLDDTLNKMGDTLKHQVLIGFTDWQAGGEPKNIKQEFFFAPTQSVKFSKQVGAEAAARQMAEGLNDFIGVAKDWIGLSYITEKAALAELYSKTIKGEVDPKKGYIVKLGSE